MADGRYSYGSSPDRVVARLWECTHAPASIGADARPITCPCWVMAAPVGTSVRAILCPAVTSPRSIIDLSPVCTVAPAGKGRPATLTLSSACILTTTTIAHQRRILVE